MDRSEDTTKALKLIARKANSAFMRIRRPRPHPNDVAWARQIMEDIIKIAEDAGGDK